MLSLALWLTVASSVTENLEVEQMTLPELKAEEVRLSLPPSRVPYATMLGLGLVALPTGVVSTVLIVEHWQRTGRSSSLNNFFNDLFYGSTSVATGIIGVAGLALSIAGGVLLWTTSRRIEDDAFRLARVRERITQREGQETFSPAEYDALEAEVLQERRPGQGFAGGLLGGGIGAFVVGFFSSYFGSAGGLHGATVAGIGEMVIGAAMVGISVWQFIARTEERDRIDARLNALRSTRRQPDAPADVPPPPSLPPLPPPSTPPGELTPPPPPPPGASLPPAPVLLSWRFAF